jgi:hypothetical protein
LGTTGRATDNDQVAMHRSSTLGWGF